MLYFVTEQSLCYPFTRFFFGQNKKIPYRNRSFLFKKSEQRWKGKAQKEAMQFFLVSEWKNKQILKGPEKCV